MKENSPPAPLTDIWEKDRRKLLLKERVVYRISLEDDDDYEDDEEDDLEEEEKKKKSRKRHLF